MKTAWALALFLLCAQLLPAQGAVPAGTLLPVSLDRSLNAAKVHPGQLIRAEVMQSVPGTPVHRHTRVLGHVVRITNSGGASVLEIRFDAIELRRERIPLKTDLRALASFIDVEDAQIPEEEASRGITPEVATTEQVGGEQVYRGGGSVMEGMTVVGEPAPYGVLGVPRVQFGAPCRGVLGGVTRPQALWIFSTDACGVYGYSNLRIEHAGRTAPRGTIVLTAVKGKVQLYGGTGLLLRVLGS